MFLISGINNWPTGIFADPLRVEGRAAFYSYGFLLRRAAAVRLDVADGELKVGLRTTGDPHSGTVGQIFMSDTLENGAGYSTHLGTPSEFQSLLQDICGPNVLGRLDQRAQQDDHGNACQTSCHECMRDYSNLAYHSILDWRLGVDLARLALDPAAPIDFSPSHWTSVPALAIQRLQTALPNSALSQFAGLPAVVLGQQANYCGAPTMGRTHSYPSPRSRRRASCGSRSWLINRIPVNLHAYSTTTMTKYVANTAPHTFLLLPTGPALSLVVLQALSRDHDPTKQTNPQRVENIAQYWTT